MLYWIIFKISGGRGQSCSPERKLVWWPPFFILLFLKGNKKQNFEIVNSRFLIYDLTLNRIPILPFSILPRLGKTNKCSLLLKSLMSLVIIKIEIKKLHGDYNYLKFNLKDMGGFRKFVKCCKHSCTLLWTELSIHITWSTNIYQSNTAND